MVTAHAALAWIAATSVVAVLVVAVLTAAGRAGRSYRLLDTAVLVQGGVAALTALAGIATVVMGRPPADGLHVVYGAVVTAVPVAVRAAAQGRGARTIGRWVAVGALVGLGATIRSFMTGT